MQTSEFQKLHNFLYNFQLFRCLILQSGHLSHKGGKSPEPILRNGGNRLRSPRLYSAARGNEMTGAGTPPRIFWIFEATFGSKNSAFSSTRKSPFLLILTCPNGRVAVQAVQVGLFLSFLIRYFRKRRKSRRERDLSLFLICLRRGRLPVSQFSVPVSGKLLLLSRTLSFGVKGFVFFCFDC